MDDTQEIHAAEGDNLVEKKKRREEKKKHFSYKFRDCWIQLPEFKDWLGKSEKKKKAVSLPTVIYVMMIF